MNNVEKDMNFSDQALGAVMMALQKSLMDQSDIVPVLKGFRCRLSESGLMVMNPPMVKFEDNEAEVTPMPSDDPDVNWLRNEKQKSRAKRGKTTDA